MDIKEKFERFLKEQASKASNKLITAERSNLIRSYLAGGKRDWPMHAIHIGI